MSKNRVQQLPFKVDDLFAEFIREMDEQSTNGTIKKLDPLKIEPLVNHFLEQCDNFEDKLELHEHIQILLSSKFNYALVEENLGISSKLEKSIHQKIKDIIKTNFENAAKFAGFVLNWTVVKPIKFIKMSVEPVIANTVLTYSIAVHPPYLDSVDMTEFSAIKPDHGRKTEMVHTAESESRLKKDLEAVKKYSDEDFVNLTQNASNETTDEKKALQVTKVSPSSAVVNTKLTPEKDNTQNVYTDLERRIIQRVPVTPKETQSSLAVNRFRGELRPIGDVQRVIAQNDHRIYNCFNIYKRNSTRKNGRISMKFQISSKGMVKDVKVTYNSFSSDLAERVTLQIKTLRFNEVEPKLGDQTIYHTFYF